MAFQTDADIRKIMKNISLLMFNCPCRVRDKSELESKRRLTLVHLHHFHCHQACLSAPIDQHACHATASQEVLFSSR